MQPQTIDNDLAQPANDNAGGRARSSDSFVEAALDAFTALDEPQQKRPRKEVRRQEEAPDADPEGDEREAEPATEPGTEPEEEEDEQAGAEEEGADEHEHDTRGSKDEPFTVKDLPSDKFIRLKVDGQEMTVALSDLPSGWIRQETFNRWANKTKLLADEAQGMVHKAQQTRERVRQELSELLGDPDQLYDFFLSSEAREQIFERAARKYAELRMQHRKNPDERLAWLRKRDEERIAYERELFESQKRAETEERQRREHTERMRQLFQPGWEAGLRKAGFPKPNQALFDEVMVRWNQKAQRGDTVTSEDIAEFVVRAAKVLELPAQNGKKRPAPAPASSPRPTNDNGRKRADPWSGKPAREKIKDPDYFLRNLRARDFR